MAEIIPFRALHYNPEKVSDLGKVVTQPYDKISSEMQAHYYELSPYNIVRVIRRRASLEDASANSVYRGASADFHGWIEERVLSSEREPAIYPYHQEYEIPAQPGPKKERRGFVALCRLEDYSARVVHRHEETLSGPKADRLELLKATRAHFGQIFMLYSDPEGAVEALLRASTRAKPWESVTDEHDTRHSVWRIADPRTIEYVVEAMLGKKLVIADGHHRYETALAYRDDCRAQGQDQRAEYVMATFIGMETDGFTILPTQCVVQSLPAFDWGTFRTAAQPLFEWYEIAEGTALQTGKAQPSTRDRLAGRLAGTGRDRPTFGVYAGAGKAALLQLRQDLDLAALLPDLALSLRQLVVVILHRLILERVLGIDRWAVREEKNLRYLRESGAALRQVDEGEAQVCFLLNPTPIEAVRDNAFAGHVLPQKSTDFYPKLLSGLTIYWLDNPAGI